eukprot:13368499-Alexandrium_andersonii.AAC.1
MTKAKLWSTASGECLLTLGDNAGLVTSAGFSPEGRQLVTTSFDRTAKVWGASTGNCELTLRGHADRVRSGAFSPEGSQI